MPITFQHRVIRGYRQRGRLLSGSDCLIEKLDEFRGRGTHIACLDWDDDMESEAAEIARHAPADAWPIVCLYPYSWGFGWGAMRLAKALAKYDIDVYAMVVCDGVYRHSYRLGDWRALWQRSVIRLPDNVYAHNVRLFVQQNTWLRGHRVECSAGQPIAPNVIEEIEVPCGSGFVVRTPATHYNLDESKDWHDACIEAARCVHTTFATLLKEKTRGNDN